MHSDGDYILNMYSLHNYHEIQSVVPVELRTMVCYVSDHAQIRKAAAEKIRNKKAAAKCSDSAPPNAEPLGQDADSPAFDQPVAAKKKTKPKPKIPVPNLVPRPDPTPPLPQQQSQQYPPLRCFLPQYSPQQRLHLHPNLLQPSPLSQQQSPPL